MARSFADIGAGIFGFFFGPEDYYRSLAITTTGPASFAVARDNKDDGDVETYFTVTQQLNGPALSSVSFTTSDASNPSLSVESEVLKHKHISMSSTICDPSVSFNIGFNDEDKYALDCSLSANFDTHEFQTFNICAAYDSLLNKNLLIGANFNVSNEEQPNEMKYAFGLEYQSTPRLNFGVLASNNLQNFDVGLSFARNDSTTVLGKVSAGVDMEHKPELSYALGVNYHIDDDSTLDCIVNNNNTASFRYSLDNEHDESSTFKFHAFLAAHLNFNQNVANRAKIQYGVSIE